MDALRRYSAVLTIHRTPYTPYSLYTILTIHYTPCTPYTILTIGRTRKWCARIGCCTRSSRRCATSWKIILILFSYCTHTVLILYSYCTHTVLILYSYYCTHTVLILYSYYCTHHTVLTILYSPYHTYTIATSGEWAPSVVNVDSVLDPYIA
jgi:hypothetical protein